MVLAEQAGEITEVSFTLCRSLWPQNLLQGDSRTTQSACSPENGAGVSEAGWAWPSGEQCEVSLPLMNSVSHSHAGEYSVPTVHFSPAQQGCCTEQGRELSCDQGVRASVPAEGMEHGLWGQPAPSHLCGTLGKSLTI